MKKHNVRKFNATGDGVHDDRAAIQSAIDATIAAGGGVVFFPAGDYVVGRIPTPETSLVSFYIHGVTTDTPLVFEGEGAASIIRMQAGSVGSGEKWSIFHVVASENVSFRHLRLHGNGGNISSLGNKEIHCILLKRAVDVTVQNVEFRETVGHGIKLEGKIAGERGAESRVLRIVENLFVDSGRGGIKLDGTTEPIEDVVIQGNIVRHTAESFAVTLDNTSRVQFVSNTILRGVVACTDIQDFVISNNLIVRGVLDDDAAALNLLGKALHGAVTGNIIRAEHMPKARGIRVLSSSSGKSPKKIRLSQNTIRSVETGINLNGQDISVSDNVFEHHQIEPHQWTDEVRIISIGISVGRVVAGILGDAIQVRNNHIRNFECGIQATAEVIAGDLTRLVVVGNQIRGASPDPRTGAAIHIRHGVPAATVHGNQVDRGETIRLLRLDSGYIVTAGGFAGNGSPEGVVTAEVGSLYTQLDANSVLPRLWVKETGTGATGWVSYASRGLNVRMFGAKGDGRTDDREAIKNAMTAAVALGAEVFFPPGTYIVGQEPSKPFCLDLPGSNLALRGVRGASWLKQPAGLPGSGVTLLHVDSKTNVTIRDLGFDGNWGNAMTTISQASHGAVMSQETEIDVNVISTTGFPVPEPSATFIVNNETITYTGKTATSFTGCTGGTSTLLRLQAVGYIDDNIGINHGLQGNPQNHGIMIQGSTNVLIDGCVSGIVRLPG